MTFTNQQLIVQAREEVDFWREREEVIPTQQTAIRLRLAEITLAALTADPVAIIDQANLDYLKSGADADVWPPERAEMGDMLLYAAPPAPVVPAEIRNRFRSEGLAELLKDVRDYAPLTAGQWETLTKNWHQTFVGLSGEGDACRAAMLQGAEPTQEWIPCSERMPEAGQKVLAYRPDAPESDDPLVRMATYVGRSPHGHGFDCYCKPSHWMPLPAAPQQEVKS